VTTTDAGTWADLNCSVHACDNRPGIPCGYTPTNGGQGYTCSCADLAFADPWLCVPPDAGVGHACPDAGP
jgi:hypothetical protein